MTGIAALKRVFGCALLVFCGESAWAAELPAKIHGRVVLDANANGQLDADEKGVAGVAVSDGVQWVLTDAAGNYELTLADDPLFPFRGARTITMSWPSNFWPSSLWWRRLADLPADGRLDFGLRPDKQLLPITFVHGTDPHNSMIGVFNKVMRDEIERMKSRVHLAFITGDLGYASYPGVEQSFPPIRQYTDAFPVPMFHAIGNHDVVGLHGPDWSKPTEFHGYGAFTKYISPVRWSFDYAGIHFVGLDWSHRVGPELKTLETSGIEETAAKWLDADLSRVAKPARIYLFMHNGYDVTDRLAPLLAKHHVELFLAGHSHRNVDDEIAGTPYLMTCNMIGPYKLVNITDKGFQVIHRCMGCKQPGINHRGGSASYPKTGGCRVFIPDFTARRGAHGAIAEKSVDAAGQPAGDVKAQRLEAALTVEPGTAKAWGVGIGPDSNGKSVEFWASPTDVSCGDVVTDPARDVGQKIDTYHFALDEGGLSVWCNNHARFDVPYIPSSPVGVMAIAKDGAAQVHNLDVWELKPGAPIRQYKEK